LEDKFTTRKRLSDNLLTAKKLGEETSVIPRDVNKTKIWREREQLNENKNKNETNNHENEIENSERIKFNT